MAEARKLKIKAGACKRLVKELSYYETEVDTEEAKLGTMVEEGADEARVKQQQGVVAESRAMLPAVTQRLRDAEAALQLHMDENKDSLAGTAEWADAEAQLASAQSVLSANTSPAR